MPTSRQYTNRLNMTMRFQGGQVWNCIVKNKTTYNGSTNHSCSAAIPDEGTIFLHSTGKYADSAGTHLMLISTFVSVCIYQVCLLVDVCILWCLRKNLNITQHSYHNSSYGQLVCWCAISYLNVYMHTFALFCNIITSCCNELFRIWTPGHDMIGRVHHFDFFSKLNNFLIVQHTVSVIINQIVMIHVASIYLAL